MQLKKTHVTTNKLVYKLDTDTHTRAGKRTLKMTDISLYISVDLVK